ncbi:radical SAM protein [Mariprofundus erugo]|uniref:7-carboxy-7-deazaguanine synthase n=1 Tax=Mariprofundus erugo TaxID=2528639 RepID=A0A5R9GGF9_9PROT|nr:radical SAM protein [Mariprofundus erugo]TLS65996.1 radical SAM protein [Mariprofundus erugo]
MPCTFVRLAGCPLRCTYCDTPQAIPTDSGEWMRIADVVDEVRRRARPLVLVTGGEPLAQRNCAQLLSELLTMGSLVQLETSGAYPLADLPAGVRKIVDLKAPGSGEVLRNRLDLLADLSAGDEIKIVLTDRADYEWARGMIEKYQLGLGDVPVLLSSAWGSLGADQLCQWLLEDRLPARLQLQLHKVIWGEGASGV